MGNFLGWMLESSLLILLVLGIRKLFMGKIRYASIYALWLIVLLRLVIPVNFISTPLSVGAIVSEALSSLNPESSVEIPVNPGDTTAIDKKPDEGLQTEAADGYQLLTTGNKEGENSGQKTTGQNERQGNAVLSFLAKINVEKYYSYFVKCRAAGSGILLLWFGLSNILLVRRLKKNRVLCGMRGGIKIYVVSEVRNPCLYGFFRPAIYLPKAVVSDGNRLREGEEAIRQMITHEYVHYRHKDHIWAMFRMLLVSAYWFNPFVWLAASCSKKDAELYCDEGVIRLLGEEKRFEYGKMLVRLAGDAAWGEFRYPIMSMSRRGKEMEKRIRALSSRDSYKKWVIIPLVAVVTLAVGITCSTGIRPAKEEGRQTEKSAGAENRASDNSAEDSGISSDGTSEGKAEEGGHEIEQVSADENTPVKASEEVFYHYMELFTEAVNTGDTASLSQVLDVNSDVYEQQCNLVKNYYKRGIQEEIKSFSAVSTKEISPNLVEVYSKEKIKVYYGDDTTKMIRQRYYYTCEYIDGRWLITKMEDRLV